MPAYPEKRRADNHAYNIWIVNYFQRTLTSPRYDTRRPGWDQRASTSVSNLHRSNPKSETPPIHWLRKPSHQINCFLNCYRFKLLFSSCAVRLVAWLLFRFVLIEGVPKKTHELVQRSLQPPRALVLPFGNYELSTKLFLRFRITNPPTCQRKGF